MLGVSWWMSWRKWRRHLGWWDCLCRIGVNSHCQSSELPWWSERFRYCQFSWGKVWIRSANPGPAWCRTCLWCRGCVWDCPCQCRMISRRYLSLIFRPEPSPNHSQMLNSVCNHWNMRSRHCWICMSSTLKFELSTNGSWSRNDNIHSNKVDIGWNSDRRCILLCWYNAGKGNCYSGNRLTSMINNSHYSHKMHNHPSPLNTTSN